MPPLRRWPFECLQGRDGAGNVARRGVDDEGLVRLLPLGFRLGSPRGYLLSIALDRNYRRGFLCTSALVRALGTRSSTYYISPAMGLLSTLGFPGHLEESPPTWAGESGTQMPSFSTARACGLRLQLPRA